jgi:hypothetical protein
MLRNAGQARLWLIYFKGLLIAHAHLHGEMVPALPASSSGFGRMRPLSKGP